MSCICRPLIIPGLKMIKTDLSKWDYPAPPKSYELDRASKEQTREIQDYGLKRLVNYCWEHVPFYRKRWEKAGVHPSDIRGIEDIIRIPIVTKEELQEDLKQNPPFGTYQGDISACRIQSSSGTTGMPKPFFQTKRDWDIAGNLWARRLDAQGITPADRVQVCLTYSLFIPGFTATEGAMKLGATVIPVGSGAATSTERQVILAKDWGATCLIMTPTFALYFADVAEKMGYDLKRDFQIRKLIHTGESMPKALRTKIEERWQIPAYDNLGSVESGGAPTFECELRNGLHINEDAFYFEVIDPKTGKNVPDGQEGLLVMTTLFKEGAPMVRYNIGDFTTIISEPCSCGRTFRRIAGVNGRIDDMLKIRGVAVYPASAETVVRKYKELGSEYRLVIDKIANQDVIKLQCEVIHNKDLNSPELKAGMEHELKVVMGIKCKVELLAFGVLAQETAAHGRIKFKRILDRRNSTH